MKFSVFIAVWSGLMLILAGCNSNPSSSLVATNGQTETTGYWYLGDNGQRQWRSFTTTVNDDAKANSTLPNGISQFGNGSGH